MSTGEMEMDSVEATACCDNADMESQGVCGLCEKIICGNCWKKVNEITVCGACKETILEELENEKAGVTSMPVAIVLGIVAAIVSGAIWAAVAIGTNHEIGYLAIGVGWLAGMGVFLGGGKKRGMQLQIVSVVCAVLGLFLAKYFMFAHAVKQYAAKEGADLGYFSANICQAFFENINEMVTGYDLLWVILALGAAWKVCAPIEVKVS